jgi:hypothetical protein
MWEPDMQCNGEAVLWSLGFGLPVASVAIGGIAAWDSLFVDEEVVHDGRLGLLRLRGVLRMEVAYVYFSLFPICFRTRVMRGSAS